MPRAFGTFQNNLVLNRGVCRSCNQYFGETIDRMFSRGSAEGLLRYEYNLRPPQEIQKILKNRLSFSLSTDDELDGLLMEQGLENGQLVVTFLPQVGFPRRDKTGWVYISEADLEDLSIPLLSTIDTSDINILIFNSKEMKERLNQTLRSRGIEPRETISEDLLSVQAGDNAMVGVKAILDDMNLRCVAKIAFNYLARHAGLDFVTSIEFDAVRKYIRYGARATFEIVSPKLPVSSTYEPTTQLRATWHELLIDWPQNGRKVIGQLTLFNFVKYDILFALNHAGIWRPIREQHRFYVDRGVIESLN